MKNGIGVIVGVVLMMFAGVAQAQIVHLDTSASSPDLSATPEGLSGADWVSGVHSRPDRRYKTHSVR
jgi:hypothetical protein